MKDYLQPAATFALALAIASLPFTLPVGVKAMDGATIWVRQLDDSWTIRGCN